MSDDAAVEGADGEDELTQLRRKLSESEEGRASDKETFDTKMQEIRQKTKDHMSKFQERTQAVMKQKDSQLQELEATKEEAVAEVASLRAKQAEASSDSCGQDASKADATVQALEQELATLREQLRVQATEAAQACRDDGAGDEELRACRLELQEARSQRDASQADAQGVRRELADLQEELARSRQETQSKISEVVQKAKEHVKQVQTRLETQTSENKHLQSRLDAKEAEHKDVTEKFREVDDVYAQQQDKLTKFKQLMAQANARIEDSDEGAREVRESLTKLQAEHERLKQSHQSAESAYVPPTREEIIAMGGVLLTVEAENDDVWCLLRDGNNNAISGDPTTSRRRWWLSSQVDVDDKPIPLQRRWKGEVSALRAQTARAKKRGEDMQEEFEAYKQKANAALQTGAAHSGDIVQREKKVEHLGQQLQSTVWELQEAKAEKAKVFEDLGEVRRRLQDALAQKGELERTLTQRTQEAQQAKDAAVAECRGAFETDKDSLSQKLREKERHYLQELDLRRAQKESLEEEIEGLRSRLASRFSSSAAFMAEPPAESGSEDGRGPNLPSSLSSPDRDTARAGVAVTPRSGQGLERLGRSPPDDAVWRGAQPSPGTSPRPSPRSDRPPMSCAGEVDTSAGSTSCWIEANPASSSSAGPAPPGGVATTDASNGLAVPHTAPVTDGEAVEACQGTNEQDPPMCFTRSGSVLRPQAYTLQASVAFQDLVSLRAQVRLLEASLQDQKQQHSSLERENSSLACAMHEVEERQRLQNVVGQHQQMEYIRNVFRKFVETLPAGQAEHEQLIPVLMTFFQFAPDESRTVQAKRQQATKSQGFWPWKS